MRKFQNRYLLKHSEKAKPIRDTNIKHIYTQIVIRTFFDGSALSRYEVLTAPIYKCNEDQPYYATQYQHLFIQYKEGFNFTIGITSEQFKDVHIPISNNAPLSTT